MKWFINRNRLWIRSRVWFVMSAWEKFVFLEICERSQRSLEIIKRICQKKQKRKDFCFVDIPFTNTTWASTLAQYHYVISENWKNIENMIIFRASVIFMCMGRVIKVCGWAKFTYQQQRRTLTDYERKLLINQNWWCPNKNNRSLAVTTEVLCDRKEFRCSLDWNETRDAKSLRKFSYLKIGKIIEIDWKRKFVSVYE